MKSVQILSRTIPLILSLVVAATASGMDNSDVLKMHEAGLSEDTIVTAVIHADSKDFDTTAMGLVELKEAGLSERVIQAVIQGTDPGASEEALAEKEAALNELFPDIPTEKVMPPMISPERGKTYYTRINFWYEDEHSYGTNYSRGILVPINTEVQLVKVKRDEFTLLLPGGQSVEIENVEDYTRASMDELLTRYLADEPTRVELYGEEAANQIMNGIMRLGMTKDQVLLTRGYPPFHRTPGLDADQWVYWSSRFVQMTIVFRDGRLVEGRGLN